MTQTSYIYQSKTYTFGAGEANSTVAGAVKTGVPTTALVMASWGRALQADVASLPRDEHVKLVVNFGKAGTDYVVLDTQNNIDLLNQELTDLGGYLPSANPASTWSIQFTVTFKVDSTTKSDYMATELFQGYPSRNRTTHYPEFHLSPMPLETHEPLMGVQAVFIPRGADFTLATAVSDVYGRLTCYLPPGSYDVQLHGSGFQTTDWLTGGMAVTLGAGSSLAPFGRGTVDVVKAGEFNYLKSLFSSLGWPGYMVAEDFTDARKGYRVDNPSADTAAYQNFGRIYRGLSWMEYFGIVTDPNPV